jgi:DnaK suppressor protein
LEGLVQGSQERRPADITRPTRLLPPGGEEGRGDEFRETWAKEPPRSTLGLEDGFMLNEKNLQKLRQHLEQERTRLQSHIADLEDMLRLEDREIGSGEDDADIAARAISYNGLLTLLESEQETLTEVESALQAMDDGAYGRCAICGREIELARLEARPYTRRCITCQERESRL